MTSKSVTDLLGNDVLADVLAKLGVQTRPSGSGRVMGAMGIFGVGLLVGAGVALLLTPKPGRELRQAIRAKVTGGAEELTSGAPLEVPSPRG